MTALAALLEREGLAKRLLAHANRIDGHMAGAGGLLDMGPIEADLRQAADALSAPAERGVAEPVWRTDFASAPRDGSWVELRSPNGDAQRLFWSTHYSINGLGGCWTEGFVTMSDFDFTGWRAAPPPPAGMVSAETREPKDFATWWSEDGQYLDPDTSDVPWFDKRRGLAEYAFNAGAATGQPAQGDGT